jgi:DNA-binding protein H-NS
MTMDTETTEELNQSELGPPENENPIDAHAEYLEKIKAARKTHIVTTVQQFMEELGQVEFNDVLRTASEQAIAAIAEKKRVAHEQANAILVAAGLPPLNISQQTAPTHTATRSSGTGNAVPAKYRDPENPDKSWSGRGIKPRWLTALIEKGHPIEEYAVQISAV